MVDLHSHILPCLDDGASDLEVSLAMARIAVSAGTRTLVGTPHLNLDYPVDPAEIPQRVTDLQVQLEREEIPLKLLAGAELSLLRLGELDDEALRQSCLADGHYLLVESPYGAAAPFLEEQLFDLQTRGFRPLLAHPERCPLFHRDRARLERLVRRGVICSITAGSITGRFGRTVRRFTTELLEAGLVHDVSSDSHDPVGRPPGLQSAAAALASGPDGGEASADWYTREVPEAIVRGEALPARPEPPGRRPFPRRRLFRSG